MKGAKRVEGGEEKDWMATEEGEVEGREVDGRKVSMVMVGG